MKNLRLLVLLLTFIVAFNSCKKKDDPAPPTKTDLLTAKTWKVSGLTVNPRFPADTSGTNFLPEDLYAYNAGHNGACINDDIYIFKKSPATYSLEEGATKCDPTDPQVFDTGTWSFSSDESTLVLTAPGSSPRNYPLLELSATTLKYTYTITGRVNSTSPVVTYTFTQTLSNQ